MRCQEAFELMSAALDRETATAAGADGEGLRQHLAGCEPCRIQQVTLGVIHGRLRQLRGRPDTPAQLRARVHQQCRQNQAGCGHADRSRPAPARSPIEPPTVAARPRSRSRTGWGMGVTGAAAALFVLFVLGTGPHGGIISGAGSGAPAGASPSGAAAVIPTDGACRLATSGGSPVALACVTGGRRGARQVMEQLTELARSRGLDVRCASCHLDERSFQLLGGAREKFASLLEATRT